MSVDGQLVHLQDKELRFRTGTCDGVQQSQLRLVDHSAHLVQEWTVFSSSDEFEHFMVEGKGTIDGAKADDTHMRARDRAKDGETNDGETQGGANQ